MPQTLFSFFNKNKEVWSLLQAGQGGSPAAIAA
jgi:hypothetical protein